MLPAEGGQNPPHAPVTSSQPVFQYLHPVFETTETTEKEWGL